MPRNSFMKSYFHDKHRPPLVDSDIIKIKAKKISRSQEITYFEKRRLFDIIDDYLNHPEDFNASASDKSLLAHEFCQEHDLPSDTVEVILPAKRDFPVCSSKHRLLARKTFDGYEFWYTPDAFRTCEPVWKQVDPLSNNEPEVF